MNDENTQEVFNLQANFCKALADTKRLQMIHDLRDGERSVNDIAHRLGLKQSNTSQHLAVLRKAGILAPRRDGNTIYYGLANPRIGQACDLVRSFIAEQLKEKQNLAESM